MRIYLQLAALLLVLIAMTYRTCHRTNVEPFNIGHNIDSLLTQTEVLRERARIAENKSRERDTIYIQRVKYIRTIAPAECDTFIQLVVAECDTLVQIKEVEIAVKDSVIVADSTLIVAQAKETRKQRRHKRMAVLGVIILGVLAVVK
jgi:hypothetical protein